MSCDKPSALASPARVCELFTLGTLQSHKLVSDAITLVIEAMKQQTSSSAALEYFALLEGVIHPNKLKGALAVIARLISPQSQPLKEDDKVLLRRLLLVPTHQLGKFFDDEAILDDVLSILDCNEPLVPEDSGALLSPAVFLLQHVLTQQIIASIPKSKVRMVRGSLCFVVVGLYCRKGHHLSLCASLITLVMNEYVEMLCGTLDVCLSCATLVLMFVTASCVH